MRKAYTVIRNHRILKQTRWLILLLIALALVGLNADPGSVAARNTPKSLPVPQDPGVPVLAGTLDLITNVAGDQVDAHLDCDLVSYTNDDLGALQIKYHDLNTNIDHSIPANGAASQSDVSGGRIAFTEQTASGSYVVVFDSATQTRTDVSDVTPGKESNSSIGGNVVAFEDRSFSINPNLSEIGVYELDADFYTRLTSDSLFDKNPAVSPDGNVIVWEKCQATGLGCDIYSAIRKGTGLFQTQSLTGGGEDRGPVTNGQIVAYVSDKSGENDIYLQPVAGGTELHVPIAGDQRNLAISGDLIAFESQVQLDGVPEYDIFVYDVRTANLYQVTNTAVDDSLGGISTCSGAGRIVYVAPQSGYDVFSFTFQVPSSPADEVNDLINLLQSFKLPRGIESRLIQKLQDALAAINNDDTATACDSLTSFINTCQALPGKKLTADQSTQLITAASKIKTDLGCP